jgi:proteasome alpha subunit
LESAQNFGRVPFFYGPEGRLVQVDYALEAVTRGSTTVGLKTNDFVLLASHVKPVRPLMDPAEKIYTIDENVGATGSGYISDVLKLVDEVRIQAQRHRLTLGTPSDTRSLAQHIGGFLHEYTLYTVRPLGASLILGGIDPTGLNLYQVDPSGTYFSGSAFTIGQNSDTVFENISREYSPNLDERQAIDLVSKSIQRSTENSSTISMGIVRKTTKKFEKIN